jgi:hypothetical protein
MKLLNGESFGHSAVVGHARPFVTPVHVQTGFRLFFGATLDVEMKQILMCLPGVELGSPWAVSIQIQLYQLTVVLG